MRAKFSATKRVVHFFFREVSAFHPALQMVIISAKALACEEFRRK
jgi:hypothetical protein